MGGSRKRDGTIGAGNGAEAVVEASQGAHGSPRLKSIPRRRRQLLAETELRRYFNQIVEQPVPDEFLELLRRIDARLHG